MYSRSLLALGVKTVTLVARHCSELQAAGGEFRVSKFAAHRAHSQLWTPFWTQVNRMSCCAKVDLPPPTEVFLISCLQPFISLFRGSCPLLMIVDIQESNFHGAFIISSALKLVSRPAWLKLRVKHWLEQPSISNLLAQLFFNFV